MHAAFGAQARVESAGEIDRRLSLTRLVATGPLGLFWRKKVDRRELYRTVEGTGFAFVVELKAKQRAEARMFAAKINGAAPRASMPATVGEDSATAPLAQPRPAVAPQTVELPPDTQGSAPPQSAIDPLDQLKKAAELRDAGILTEEEFQEQKTRLLGTTR